MTDALVQVHTDCPVDLVLANAGIVAAASPGSSSSSAGVAALADNLWAAAHTNIMGTLNTVTPALPLLKATAAAGRPAAVAITSSVSVLPKDAVLFTGQLQMGLLPYAWSKQALLSLGQGLQGELAGGGIQVFTICPGVVLTGLATELAESFVAGAGTAADAAAAPGDTGASLTSGRSSSVQPVAAVGAAGGGPVAVTGEDVLKKRPAAAAAAAAAAALDVLPEEALKQKLGAMTAEDAAAYICHGIAGGKGGVLAFPAAAVRTMKVMAMLPQQALVKAVKRGVDRWYAEHHKTAPLKTTKLPA
ncbi:hypothetical protein OEZ85_006492 [Tetradesmus obliquus]|uniref:Uncharacterized protein n=1 Tax=Tetradesmus obliquus TaxID=3088 RepID=A0ABY8TUR0_TETOB|nr:hypothetical protein OEZ85_006492 [Tetradesmus obliquus]